MQTYDSHHLVTVFILPSTVLTRFQNIYISININIGITVCVFSTDYEFTCLPVESCRVTLTGAPSKQCVGLIMRATAIDAVFSLS